MGPAKQLSHVQGRHLGKCGGVEGGGRIGRRRKGRGKGRWERGRERGGVGWRECGKG